MSKKHRRAARPLVVLLTSVLCWSGSAFGLSDMQRLREQAKRFEHGVGAPQDLDQAVSLYCQASALGDTHSKYEIGWLYLTGRLGKVDQVLAAAWFQFAAADEHPRALQMLRQLDALDRKLDQRPECVLKASLQDRTLPPRETAAPAASEQESDAVVIREPGRADIIALVRRLAPDYGLDPDLVLAVIEVESNFRIDARSDKNAQGLMQLIPATAERFEVTNIWEPVANLRGGMAYLQWLLKHFNGDLELALAGYNAGENAVLRHGGIPPYAETQAYVARVKAIYGKGSSAASADGQAHPAGSRVALTSSARILTVGEGGLVTPD